MIESEKLLEKKLRESVKARGGLCIKLLSNHYLGLPDRMILLPGGVVKFAEIKTTGKKPTKLQTYVHEQIRSLGFEVYVVDRSEQIKLII